MSRNQFLFVVLGIVLLGVVTVSVHQFTAEPAPRVHVIEDGEAPAVLPVRA